MPDLPYDIGHRPTNLPDLARTLHAAAQGRREHANSHPRGEAWDRLVELLHMQADTPRPGGPRRRRRPGPAVQLAAVVAVDT